MASSASIHSGGAGYAQVIHRAGVCQAVGAAVMAVAGVGSVGVVCGRGGVDGGRRGGIAGRGPVARGNSRARAIRSKRIARTNRGGRGRSGGRGAGGRRGGIFPVFIRQCSRCCRGVFPSWGSR